MISYNSTNNCSPTCIYTNPCCAILSNSNCNSSCKKNNLINCCPSNCYRPLQQLYKTVYSPMCRNNASYMNFACICRPAERYKTTNMTYGRFYYDNWTTTKKNRPSDYDRALFTRCYNRNKKKRHQPIGNNDMKNTIISNLYDAKESEYWSQTTNDACCPNDCCTNTTYSTTNCVNYNNDPCYSLLSQRIIPSYSSQISPVINKTCDVQVRCV